MSLLATSRGPMMMRGIGRTQGLNASRLTTRTSTTYTTTSNVSSTSTNNNPFTRAFRWYTTKLETHPLLTKGLTAGTIGGLGDVLCQRYVDKPEKELQGQSGDDLLWWFDYKRTARFFGVGVVVVGPWCHAWFGWLARTFPKLTFQSIATRVALDQFAFTPIILSTFISSIWQLESWMGDADEKNNTYSIPQRLRSTLPSIIVANWMVWGPVQLINFRFVPQPMQVLFANMISLVWNAYLSFSTRAVPENVTEKQEQAILDAAPAPVVMVQRMTSKVEERLHAKHDVVVEAAV